MGPGKTTTRTRRRAVPWVLLGLWVALLAFVAPFASKLADVQHDRAVDYLPASADSTQVAKIEEQLPGGETTELVLVYHRDGGLTAADRTTARAAGRRDRGREPAHRDTEGRAVRGRDHPDVPGGQHRAGDRRGEAGRVRQRRTRRRPGRGRAERRRRRAGGAGHRRRRGLQLPRRAAALHHRRRGRPPADPHLPQPAAVARAARRRGHRGLSVDGRRVRAPPGVRHHHLRTELGRDDDPGLRRRAPTTRCCSSPATGRNCGASSGRTTPCGSPCAAAGPPCSPPPAPSPPDCCACSPPTSTAAGAWARWAPSECCARSSPC